MLIDDVTRYETLAMAAVMVMLLYFWHRRTKTLTRQQRASMFDDCMSLINSPNIEQDDVNFPLLSGFFRGYRVQLKPIYDPVVFRKLPSLWLSVSLFRPTHADGVLDYLVRPQNTEFYSPWADLPHDLAIPDGWPRHAVLRTNAVRPWPMERITPHMKIFDDPKVKEMLISPSGVRLVYQIDESQRSHYLVLRQPLFENLRLDPTRLSDILDAVMALSDSVSDMTDSEDPSDLSCLAPCTSSVFRSVSTTQPDRASMTGE